MASFDPNAPQKPDRSIAYATDRNSALASMLLNSSLPRGAGSVVGSAAGSVVGSARASRSSAPTPTEGDEEDIADGADGADSTAGADAKKKKNSRATPAEKAIAEAEAQKALTQEKQFSKSVCGWTQQAAGGMYT